jgi:hypothetical protein
MIRRVPDGLIDALPRGLGIALRDFLSDVRESVQRLELSHTPPPDMDAPKVSALPGGHFIAWNRKEGVDSYTLLAADTPAIDYTKQGFLVMDMGNSNSHSFIFGKSGVTKYFWIIGHRGTKSSPPAGPVSAVSLGLAVEQPAVALPDPGPLAYEGRSGRLELMPVKGKR